MILARKTGWFAAALLSLTQSVWAAAQPGAVKVDQAPPAWVAYAQRISGQFQAVLAGNSVPARRFRHYVNQLGDAGAAGPLDGIGGNADPTALTLGDGALPDPPTFRVKVWLDDTGVVTRVETDDIDDAQALADLGTALVGRNAGARPPRGMKQPVVVRLTAGVEP